MKSRKINIESLTELSSFAKTFANELIGGEVVLLSGELGAGKTTFVKELIKALGGKESVTSPTFVLRNEYKILDKTFFHIDLYRLEKGKAKTFEFLENIGEKNTISCIEWPERIGDIASIPGKKISLQFTITGESSRILERS